MNPRIDEATGYKLCKRGHVRSPENLYKNGACILCGKAEAIKRRDAHSRLIGRRIKNEVCVNGHIRTELNTKGGRCLVCIKNSNERARPYRAAYSRREDVKLRISEQRKKRYRSEYSAAKAQEARKIQDISDSYARGLLGLAASLAPQELIEIKRLTIQLKRSLKNGNQI